MKKNRQLNNGGFVKEIYNTKPLPHPRTQVIFVYLNLLIPLSTTTQKFSFRDFFLKNVIYSI